MREGRKRKVYSPEFKAKVGLEALKGGKTINEMAQEYGVHPVQIGQWKKAIQEQAKSLFEGRRGPKPVAEHREPERLYSEIGKLKMDLNWLKKGPGSVYHEAAIVGRPGRETSRGAPVRTGQGDSPALGERDIARCGEATSSGARDMRLLVTALNA
jgi:transposase-like protein